MRFTKMHGLGNDFVVVNGSELHILDGAGFEIPPQLQGIPPQMAIKVCDRHFGVGADGLILVLPSEDADFYMRMFNPDGSEAQMCGNGIRCAAKFAFERGITKSNPVKVQTLGGLKTIELTLQDGKVIAARVDMGPPRLERTEIPSTAVGIGPIINEPLALNDRTLPITCVSMGNPHCIVFVDDVENAPVTLLGPEIERHPSFPERTNVEFVEVVNRKEIRMRVWERGVGETLACGTGACASAVASILNGKTDRDVTVHLRGGDLKIEWPEDGSVMMTGPAVEVFNGDFNDEELEKR